MIFGKDRSTCPNKWNGSLYPSWLPHVRFGSKADIGLASIDVRFTPSPTRSGCQLWAKKTEVGVCLDIKAVSLYDNGHNLPLVVAGAAVSIATNPTRANPG
jgi:hypothetical protein